MTVSPTARLPAAGPGAPIAAADLEGLAMADSEANGAGRVVATEYSHPESG